MAKIKEAHLDMERCEKIRERYRSCKRLLVDSKRGAVDVPIRASMANLKLNFDLCAVYGRRMLKHKSKKAPSVNDIARECALYHHRCGEMLDAELAYTEKWNHKRFVGKVRSLGVRFLKRPVMDSRG